jgi:hypothetical protein
MNLSELKSMVRSHLNPDEIKAFGYDLRRRESWEALADRCREFAAAKLEQAIETTTEIIETVQILADNSNGLPVAIAETAHGAATWLVGAAIVALLAVQEYLNPGHIDRLREDMAKLQAEQEAFEIGMKAPKPAFAKYSIADLNRLSALQIRSLAQSEALPVRYEGRFIKTNDLRWMLLEVPAA